MCSDSLRNKKEPVGTKNITGGENRRKRCQRDSEGPDQVEPQCLLYKLCTIDLTPKKSEVKSLNWKSNMIYALINLLWLLSMESLYGARTKMGFLFFFKETISLIRERTMVVQRGNKKWQDSGYLLKVDLAGFSEFQYITKDKIKVQKIKKSQIRRIRQ